MELIKLELNWVLGVDCKLLSASQDLTLFLHNEDPN